MGVHTRGNGSRVLMLQVADDEIVFWREGRVHAHELSSRSERLSVVPGHQSVPVGDSSRPTAGDPDLTEDQGDRDGQEGELDARVLALLYSSADRRFRKLMLINKQSPDSTGGVHVCKDYLDVGAGDQGIMLGYASDGTGETEMRILMVGLEVAGTTTILYEMKLCGMVHVHSNGQFQRGDRGVQGLEFDRVGRRIGQVPSWKPVL